jgi:hypothetical protein
VLVQPELSTDTIAGAYGLAFNNVYLKGGALEAAAVTKPSARSVQTNIK